MCISIGVWPWPEHANYTNIPDGDRWNLSRWGGGVPFLAYAWAGNLGMFIPESWEWLAQHGYRECVLRLFLDGTTSDNPQVPPDPQTALGLIADRVHEPMRHGIQLIGVQFDNEPDLERRGAISPSDYANWALSFIGLFRDMFPTVPLISPPLAQDSPYHETWYDALIPVRANCDYIGVHYYFGREDGDTDAGHYDSPEEWHSYNPDKPIIVTECGNAADQSNIGSVCERWMSYPWLRSFHPFVLSSAGFPQWNYTEQTGNVIHDLCRKWRVDRRYPLASYNSYNPGGTNLTPEERDAILADLNHLWGMAALVDEALTAVNSKLGESANGMRERIIAIKDKLNAVP